jgi:hypothetical protein
MKAARDGAARANLGRRVEQLKFDLRVQLLQTRLAFARKRGDLPAAQQIDATLAALLKPPATSIVRTVVQHPDKTVTGEGGQR